MILARALSVRCLTLCGMLTTTVPPAMSATPSHLRKSSPSRLAPPTLRLAPSLSSLHIHGHSLDPLSLPSVPPTSQVLESSSSSVFTVDINEGILLQSEDTETEDADDVASRESDVDRVDEDSKKILRDQLRRTLSRKVSRAGGVFPTSSR
jgi:vacuolar fusion protein MON1